MRMENVNIAIKLALESNILFFGGFIPAEKSASRLGIHDVHMYM